MKVVVPAILIVDAVASAHDGGEEIERICLGSNSYNSNCQFLVERYISQISYFYYRQKVVRCEGSTWKVFGL